MSKMKLVMVGNGMAGVRTLEELLKLAPDLFDITVFGSEIHPNYNRILLSPVLAGEQTLDEIILNPLTWYQDNGITLHTGCTVTQVDRVKREVHAQNLDGTQVVKPYDRLLLATGSNPFMLPIPGKDLKGVLAYRDIADTQAMIDAAKQYKEAVVIGGGLLGLEAANGLMKRGMQVTVVHGAEWLMERQLDKVAGGLLQESLEERGMKFLMRAQTQELKADADGRVSAVCFKDGSHVNAQLVVMAVGIRPNTALAESMRLHCDRGIVVSDTLQTVTDPRIYAVGECASHRGIAYGLVAPLFEQGKVLATHLAQMGIGRYTGSLTSTKLKVTGIDLFSAGDFMGNNGAATPGLADDTEEIILSDPHDGVYKNWSFATINWWVPVCLAIRSTAVGISNCCAKAAMLPTFATSSCLANPILVMWVTRVTAKLPACPTTRGVWLQWRDQRRHLQSNSRKRFVHTGRSAQANQGQCFVWLLHRFGGTNFDVHSRWRLLFDTQEKSGMWVYRSQPPRSARCHSR